MRLLFVSWHNIVKIDMVYTGAVKIGTGKINAVTGKAWKFKHISTSNKDQNYVSLPKQPWLDGINCGDGYIRQFVAMPLGKGYTVEVQLYFFFQMMFLTILF